MAIRGSASAVDGSASAVGGHPPAAVPGFSSQNETKLKPSLKEHPAPWEGGPRLGQEAKCSLRGRGRAGSGPSPSRDWECSCQ